MAPAIDLSVVDDSKHMIDSPISKNFRMVVERYTEKHDMNVKLCLILRESRDGCMYQLPTWSKIAALIVGMFEYE